MTKEQKIGVGFTPDELKLVINILLEMSATKLAFDLEKVYFKAMGVDANAELGSMKTNKVRATTVKMEKKYPKTMDLFRFTNNYQYHLFAKKQADYGPGNISMNGNKELALLGLGVRMNDKTQRILNLTHGKSEPNNESLEDSFRDLSIYGIIAQIVLADSWGK